MSKNEPTRTASVTVRMTDEEKAAVQEMVDHLKVGDASHLIRALLEAAQEGLQKNRQLVWPPALDYYPAGTKTAIQLKGVEEE